MADTTPPSKATNVDSTPTLDSAASHATRRDSLEKQLQQRPDEQALKARHILLDTTAAPALQARALELERQRITDHLKKGLANRPEKESLVERNILADSAIVAPALQERQRELERSMRRDELERQLGARPGAEELVREGILKADENLVTQQPQ